MEKRKSFTTRVHTVVQNIPRGETLSYGAVARLAGSPGAARAVGTIMKNNTDQSTPCHRVIKSSGHVGNYNRMGGSDAKKELLKIEGAIKS